MGALGRLHVTGGTSESQQAWWSFKRLRMPWGEIGCLTLCAPGHRLAVTVRAKYGSDSEYFDLDVRGPPAVPCCCLGRRRLSLLL